MRPWHTYAVVALIAAPALGQPQHHALLIQPFAPLLLETVAAATGGHALQIPLVLQFNDEEGDGWVTELSPTFITRTTRPDMYTFASRSEVARLVVSLGHALGPPAENGFRVMGVPKVLAFAGLESESVAAGPGASAPPLPSRFKMPSGGVEVGFDLLAEARFGAVVLQGVLGLSTGVGYQIAGVDKDAPIVVGAVSAPLSGRVGQRGNAWILDVNTNAVRIGLAF